MIIRELLYWKLQIFCFVDRIKLSMNKNDKDTVIQELKDLLIKFRNERGWEQFHTPKNLVDAISIESSELLELFLWKKDADVYSALQDPVFRQKVQQELADILCYCINFSNVTGIDIVTAIVDKIEHNSKKYPAERSRNKITKYTEL